MEIAEIDQLTRELDKVKAQVFLGNNPTLMGSIMCSMNFIWAPDIQTADVDGTTMRWNPEWFMQLPPATRKTVLVHELWHVALLHPLRRGSRDPQKWNHAVDIKINNDLEDMGYSFEGTRPWKDQQYRGWVEEDIYDALPDEPDLLGSWGDGASDMVEPDEENEKAMMQEILNAVVMAKHQARMAGDLLPGNVEKLVAQFLAPKVPWEVYLHRWFSDLLDTDRNWRRPNRRYTDIYMPSDMENEGRLEHLIYFFDCSASVEHSQIVRFNSEVRYVKDMYNPAKMTLVLFDTMIHEVFEITEEDHFDKIVVKGRGGTSLVCVRDYIEQHKPTAAIIFSDLEVEPMEPLTVPIPVLWVEVGAGSYEVPFGEKIHIRG